MMAPEMAGKLNRIRRFALVLALACLPALSGCYVPVRFDAEIEISRSGYYDMIFDGYVARAALYREVRNRKIDSREEREKANAVIADFKRDSATQEADYVRQGIFKVHWRKSGDLLRTRMVAFFRRNENLLSIKYVKETGRITMAGATISPSNAQRIIDAGLNITGQLRVITDAAVARHNAGRVINRGAKQVYVWDVKSALDPPPTLIIPLR